MPASYMSQSDRGGRPPVVSIRASALNFRRSSLSRSEPFTPRSVRNDLSNRNLGFSRPERTRGNTIRPGLRRSLWSMSAGQPADALPESGGQSDVAALIPMIRRFVYSRVANREVADDLVQETLVRILAAVNRVEPGMLEPYAIVTARNVVASMWKEQDRHRRNQHRIVDLWPSDSPDAGILEREEKDAVAEALGRLSERDRRTLVAHEVSGQDTRSLAKELGMSAGAVAAQLNRSRARLRVEYLLALEQEESVTDRCRPVLFAVSSGDRRRQREVDAARHLLECDLCDKLSQPLLERGQRSDDQVRIRIHVDADIVLARQGARV